MPLAESLAPDTQPIGYGMDVPSMAAGILGIIPPSRLLPLSETGHGFVVEGFGDHHQPYRFCVIAPSLDKIERHVNELLDDGSLSIEINGNEAPKANNVDYWGDIYVHQKNSEQQLLLEQIGTLNEDGKKVIVLDDLSEEDREKVLLAFGNQIKIKTGQLMGYGIKDILSSKLPVKPGGYDITSDGTLKNEPGFTSFFGADYLKVPELRDAVVDEIFELNDGGNIVRLYNMSGICIPSRTLAEITNALRGASDETGGAITKILENIVILPPGHASFCRSNEVGFVPRTGTTVYLNGIVVMDPTIPERLDSSQLAGGNVNFVEYVMRHELAHVQHFSIERGYDRSDTDLLSSTGWEHGYGADGYHSIVRTDGHAKFPFKYGESNHWEAVAEAVAARHAGTQVGDPCERVSDILASKTHSSFEGPRFIRVTRLGPEDIAKPKPKGPATIIAHWTIR